jgi:membrane fusion protein
MSTGLFRKEVIQYQQREWLGTIRLPAPRLGWIFFGFGAVAIATAIAILVGGHFTRHERAEGSLVPSDGLLTLTPVEPGRVRRIFVREGDRVSAGQAVMEISGETSTVALGETHAAIGEQIELKRQRLQTELQQEGQLGELKRQDLEARLTLTQAQVAQAVQKLGLQKQRAASETALYEQWSALGNTGVVSKLQILQQHDTALEYQSQVKDLEAQHLQLLQQQEQLRAELIQLPLGASRNLSEIERELADANQSQLQNEAQRAVVLRAPTGGVIVNLLAHPGQMVTAQQTLMSVLPSSSALIAELWVETQSVGFIRPGEAVVIRYRAYPYQRFGQYTGHVRTVSRSAVPADEVARQLGRAITDSRYRVQVALDSQSVSVSGHDELLIPGMTLDADVLLERRRLIEWVIEPLSRTALDFRPAPSSVGGGKNG